MEVFRGGLEYGGIGLGIVVGDSKMRRGTLALSDAL